MLQEKVASLPFSPTPHVYKNVLPKETLVNGQATLQSRVSQFGKTRLANCNEIIVSGVKLNTVANYVWLVRRQAGQPFCENKSTVVSCSKWQL